MFKRLLAKMLITTTNETVFEGVTGVLEFHLNHHNLLAEKRATEMKVPQFIYDEFLAESERKGVKQTDSFAGVLIGVSNGNRFEFC